MGNSTPPPSKASNMQKSQEGITKTLLNVSYFTQFSQLKLTFPHHVIYLTLSYDFMHMTLQSGTSNTEFEHLKTKISTSTST